MKKEWCHGLHKKDFEQMWLKFDYTTNYDSLKIIHLCQKHLTNEFLNANDNILSEEKGM